MTATTKPSKKGLMTDTTLLVVGMAVMTRWEAEGDGESCEHDVGVKGIHSRWCDIVLVCERKTVGFHTIVMTYGWTVWMMMMMMMMMIGFVSAPLPDVNSGSAVCDLVRYDAVMHRKSRNRRTKNVGNK
mmetsp:Transcript_20279/g.56398  ORF Transcript_20279/g.56398 Transcript_20279/m.56398 type:complete len:129 (+) Transcript_20279:5795-6181(+)